MRTALLATLVALAASACNSPTNGHGGGAGNGGNGGSGGAGGGGGGGILPPATHDVVDPSLPPGVVGGFDGAPAGTSGLTLVYPNPGAIIQGVDDAWEVCLLKFTVDLIQQSAGPNLGDFKKRGLI